MQYITKIKKTITRQLANLPGWHTNRKIVVFESDDWGSAVMPSTEVYKYLLKKGIRVDLDPYTRLDSLASERDLDSLFDVLSAFKDINGNSPAFTANTLVANPDFKKIRESNFEQYYYEPFTETLKRYPFHQRSFDLWKEGIDKKIFFPQFHGREHLNSKLWIDELKKNENKNLRLAFDKEVFILPKSAYPGDNRIFNSAFYPNNEAEKNEMLKSIFEGIEVFKNIFDFAPESFIATGYIWNRSIEKELFRNGIKFIQGLPIQREPLIETGKFNKRINYTGKQNQFKQIFLVRNAFFEPALDQTIDWLNDCLIRIDNNFKWKKPSIISTHRLNYIGGINESNRNLNVKLLRKLIESIICQWPDVEFLTTPELGNLINKKNESREA